MPAGPPAPIVRRAFAATGALFGAVGVALGAVAAHAPLATSEASRMSTAAAYLVWHGLALLMLAPRERSRLDRAALFALTAGTVMFCGSLALAAFANLAPRLAPIGGATLIGGWLLQAIAALRR